MESKSLMIIDGNSIINRAFYAIRPLTAKDGTPTNALYGFLNILFKYLQDLNPDYLCVAFDLPAPTFRHIKYEGYKAQRKKMPDELAQQMPVLKEILRAMNVLILEKEGFEADDIIGTISAICETSDTECLIVTGDRDDLQLATQKVKIYLTTTAKGETITTVYNDQAVFEKYGVNPRALIEVKALMGDNSDNIPGVSGIGEKGALDLIQKYHSIDKIYDGLQEKKLTPSLLKKLTEGKEMAYLSRELGTIDTKVPLEFHLEDAIRKKADSVALSALYQRLGFRTFLKKLEETDDAPLSPKAAISLPEAIVLSDSPSVHKVLKDVQGELIYQFIYQSGNLKGICFELNGSFFFIAPNSQLSEEELLSSLKGIFEDDSISKVSHDIKTDIIFLQQRGIDYCGVGFDTMIGAYLLEPSMTDYSIEHVAEKFLELRLPDPNEAHNKVQTQMSLLETENTSDNSALSSYSVHITDAVMKLRSYLEQEIARHNQKELYYNIELPLVNVLAQMQINGFLIDQKPLTEFQSLLNDQIAALTKKIYGLAGTEFNIASPKQLGEVLFERLQLPVIKKTKTSYSTNIDVLEKLRGKHEIIECIMEYRQLTKLKSTYCDGLLSAIDPADGKIHSSFNQTVTVTGRISSTEPNMQNIPVRTPLGREIRKMFVADPGMVLIDADYSQIELRVLAHIAQDEVMIRAFQDKMDIHTITASQVFATPVDEVTSAQRSAAKAVNFGIVYGIGEFSLSQDIGVSVKEAKHYIDSYLEKYSGVREYMVTIKQLAKKQGYVETMFGRRRYIPELSASNFNTRAFGERVALNTPIQGSAADIIKIAMVRVYDRLTNECPEAKLLLQVHDELIVEAPKNMAEMAQSILKEEMEHAATLSVELTADVKSGHSWYDTK